MEWNKPSETKPSETEQTLQKEVAELRALLAEGAEATRAWANWRIEVDLWEATGREDSSAKQAERIADWLDKVNGLLDC